MVADPDWNDPCAVAAWLKPQMYKVAAGKAALTLKHGEEQVTYNTANYSALVALYNDATAECAVKSGSRVNKRRAFFAG